MDVWHKAVRVQWRLRFVVSFDSDLTVKPITLNFVLAEEK